MGLVKLFVEEDIFDVILCHAIGVGEMHHRCGVAANYVVSAVVMC